ncbi:hypothetical protein H5410_020958 [Solanum commersonii]|uniref:Uncharacterized protein n=1 Tax=Solanum commersonii TaxID=4109 RepID=A0A9J5ZBC8_SOLCO|nr:hypothetical protein H5410_020958 [Solanum commersonii]
MSNTRFEILGDKDFQLRTHNQRLKSVLALLATLILLAEPLSDTLSGHFPHQFLQDLQLIWGSKWQTKSGSPPVSASHRLDLLLANLHFSNTFYTSTCKINT